MLFREFLPKDVTETELELLEMVAVNVYTKLENPVDKYILAMIYDIGYPHGQVAESLGISRQALYYRIENIKKILNSNYEQPHSIKNRRYTRKLTLTD